MLISPPDHVDDLSNLIQPQLAKPSPDAGHTLIVDYSPDRSVLFGVHRHRSKFYQAEEPAVLANPFLPVKHGAPRIQFDRQRNDQGQGQENKKPEEGGNKINNFLDPLVDQDSPEAV